MKTWKILRDCRLKGDEVRPYRAAHAYLLGSFHEFHRLGSFQWLSLA